MVVCTVDSCVQGFHVLYKDDWIPIIDEELDCVREIGNIHDCYAVVVTKKASAIVSHMPRRVSAAQTLLQKEGK